MRRLLLSVLSATLLTAAVAAAEETPTAALTAPAGSAAAATLAQASQLALARPLAPSATFAAPRLRRPLVLPALYVGAAALQAYDAYSTLRVLQAGGVEANPVMRTLVKSPVAFVALKAGVTVASIAAAEKLWKQQHRVGAIAVMVASNALMGAVAAHNASVLRQVR
jgi:hypothetical protein